MRASPSSRPFLPEPQPYDKPKIESPIRLSSDTPKIMLTISDIIALSMGLAGVVIGIGTLFATLILRRSPTTQDIEMQPMATRNEHEIKLRVLELISNLLGKREGYSL